MYIGLDRLSNIDGGWWEGAGVTKHLLINLNISSYY